MKYVDTKYWDRANFSVELQQYYHSDGLWRDSGVRIAVANGVQYWSVVYGVSFFMAPVHLISDIAEAAMAGEWKDDGCWYFERPMENKTPTRIVNIRLDWYFQQLKFLAEEGEWHWRLK